MRNVHTTIFSFLMISFLIGGTALAKDSPGYKSIVEIKAWDRRIEIYLEGENLHTCRGDIKSLFKLDMQSANAEQKYSLLLATFLSGKMAKLAYKCGANDYPEILGVRTR